MPSSNRRPRRHRARKLRRMDVDASSAPSPSLSGVEGKPLLGGRPRGGVGHEGGGGGGGGGVSGGGDVLRAPKLAALLFGAIFLLGGVALLLGEEGEGAAARSVRGKGKGNEKGGRRFRKGGSLLRKRGSNATDSADGGGDDDEGGVDLAGSESLIRFDVPTLHRGKPVELPPSLQNLADTNSPLESTHKPLFWHVPRSGGSTVKDVAAFCLGLVTASEVGVADGHDEDTELGIVEDVEGARFVNVDTTNPEGIVRAKKFRIASSPAVDLIVTPYLHEVSELFDATNQGRMFALVRHPVDRAASMFHYLRSSPEYKGLLGGVDSVDKYAKSKLVENNWMTRFLSNKLAGELTPEHEAIAREVLRTKCLVGLLRRKNESVRRFEAYFGWHVDGPKAEGCHERLLNWDWSNKNRHEEVRRGSRTWELLEEQNTFDARLYEYAEQLFEAQGAMFDEAGELVPPPEPELKEAEDEEGDEGFEADGEEGELTEFQEGGEDADRQQQ